MEYVPYARKIYATEKYHEFGENNAIHENKNSVFMV